MTYFVVYHVASTQIIRETKSEAGAKRSTTCYNRNALRDKNVTVPPYAWTAYDKYREMIDGKTMKVRNLMTGKEVEIPVDTPWCCNPASETYWSM
jgi:hypothetical protein